ncbi:DUF2306 domain-containing protein [Rhodonellum sp.]|uniref:DUF2306 domain-containing protein n=1 Tax=Rhodonellum sp. TaxID=2231180 RepID=UPI002721FDD3|nr:DUF2306 domain-containing protein [Rhodonellum sp.]MDO9554703.1 DUF2306 domain-containing protein [Rhodonellum sp.]
MIKKGLWVVLAVMAILIGLYPAIYFLVDRKFGLLNTKSDALLTYDFWNVGFYTHIIFGGIALLIGWTQFRAGFRNRHLKLHKRIGKVYVFGALLSALAGIYIGHFATGGLVSMLGFILLGILWFYFTLMAYVTIKKKQIDNHEKMMIYSYALCFSAVTLRIWLPLLTMLFGDFITAYPIVAWLCWLPNLLVAFFIVRGISKEK